MTQGYNSRDFSQKVQVKNLLSTAQDSQQCCKLCGRRYQQVNMSQMIQQNPSEISQLTSKIKDQRIATSVTKILFQIESLSQRLKGDIFPFGKYDQLQKLLMESQLKIKKIEEIMVQGAEKQRKGVILDMSSIESESIERLCQSRPISKNIEEWSREDLQKKYFKTKEGLNNLYNKYQELMKKNKKQTRKLELSLELSRKEIENIEQQLKDTQINVENQSLVILQASTLNEGSEKRIQQTEKKCREKIQRLTCQLNEVKKNMRQLEQKHEKQLKSLKDEIKYEKKKLNEVQGRCHKLKQRNKELIRLHNTVLETYEALKIKHNQMLITFQKCLVKEQQQRDKYYLTQAARIKRDLSKRLERAMKFLADTIALMGDRVEELFLNKSLALSSIIATSDLNDHEASQSFTIEMHQFCQEMQKQKNIKEQLVSYSNILQGHSSLWIEVEKMIEEISRSEKYNKISEEKDS